MVFCHIFPLMALMIRLDTAFYDSHFFRAPLVMGEPDTHEIPTFLGF
jgi:hypothetical protein